MISKDAFFPVVAEKKKSANFARITGGALNIATSIRRRFRNRTANSVRTLLDNLRHDGYSSRDMYEAGWQEGKREELQDLTDVLFSCQEKGLGRLSIVQESNSHLVVKVYDCASCRGDGQSDDCSFVAGYIAGALVAAGKPENVKVIEKSCGEYPGRTCVFSANW